MKNLGRFLFLCALALAGLTVACSEEEPPPPEPVIRPVRYVEVRATGGERLRTFSGSAKPGVEIDISFKVSGTVSRLPVKIGDVVHKGDLIAELDPRDYELQVEEAKAAVAQAVAQARKAEADYERVRGLYENNNASLADLDATRTAAESAEAAVASVRKRLDMAELQLTYTTLRSPADGAVAEVPVEVNENVSPGATICTINSGAVPEVEVAVPEGLITEIREGDRVRVRFDALPGRSFGGEVYEVAVSSMRSATTFPVTVRLLQPNSRVLPGMAAEVDVRIGPADSALRYVVPPEAVAEDRQGKYIFTVQKTSDELGTVHRRKVEVGELVTEGLEVLEGLSDGDLVVTAGVTQITEGQQVKLLEEHRG